MSRPDPDSYESTLHAQGWIQGISTNSWFHPELDEDDAIPHSWLFGQMNLYLKRRSDEEDE